MGNSAGARLGAGRALAENDHAQNLVLGHVLGARCADDSTIFHHREAIGEVEHVLDIMADQENADAFLCFGS